ncbi:fructosamine kinase family protein [Aurantiacibacter poecillastricola]|uniref:fructosamine kinase family protein n=1 Tax=Aurantiacibacter poecillastricola TaxID=3064385 RepID=UPI00273E49ED|nr:fructosamine kinase family protein [Aurantiacibacter sp. 219JJ12-13]MDP5263158.1 fructosamine kinase family protein [Aurantiacibacter sp. 219JJ12-13]
MTRDETIAEALGCEVVGTQQLPGGDLGGAAAIELADGRTIVAKTGPLVQREGDMLRAIARTGAPCPAVLFVADNLLIMDHIKADGRPGWPSLAEGLANLHAPGDVLYGWDADYAFGKVAIGNRRSDNWPQFWAEQRILPFCAHVDAGLATRLELLGQRLPEMLPERPPAALLHGDLWSGNVLFHGGSLAALIDPACYHGDREVDFAMLAWLGNPPASLFEASDLAPGWRERYPVYVLWPMLVHLRLFGGGYRNAVDNALGRCGC